jgi:hypothetical protein
MNGFIKQLEYWKKKNAIFLTPIPEIKEISFMDKPVFESVYLDSDPKQHDVYLPDSKKNNEFRLTAAAKEKLSIAADVVWNLEKTGIVKKTNDYVSYQATCGIRKPDRQFVYLSSVYDLDIKVIMDELSNLYQINDEKYIFWKKAKWNKDKTRKQFESEQKLKYERDLRQKRKFMSQLAETGAKVRAISKLLRLKNTYTYKELCCPFVAVRVVFDHNNQDPIVKAELTKARIAAEFNVYGPSVNNTKQPILIENNNQVEEADFKEEPQNSEEIDFLNSDTETQFDCLEKLAKEKKYDFEKYIKGLANGYAGLSNERRIDFLNHLKSL